jgi:hypothetical protein
VVKKDNMSNRMCQLCKCELGINEYEICDECQYSMNKQIDEENRLDEE